MRLIQKKRVAPLLLTTHRFPFAGTNEVFETLQTKKDGMTKPLITFGTSHTLKRCTVKHHPHWIVTADERTARLFSCQQLPGGGLHLEQLTSIENTHEAEHERHRPTLAGGAERRGSAARSGAHAAPHLLAPRHTAEEEQRRFAREVSAWLEEIRPGLATGRLTVFAPPRFLGLLREQGSRHRPADLRDGDLNALRTRELAAHPKTLEAAAAR